MSDEMEKFEDFLEWQLHFGWNGQNHIFYEGINSDTFKVSS